MCPKCGSKNIYIDKKGGSTGKAIAGGLLTGNIFVAAAAGGIGANKIILTCLDCGKKFNVILWTAYLIEYESRKRKLLKEYGEFIKSKERWNTAPVSPSTHGR